MQNVEFEVQGDRLVITVDLSQVVQWEVGHHRDNRW